MLETTKKIVLENIKLDNITDPCSLKIETIADEFSGIEYNNEQEYVEFQDDIGKLVEYLSKLNKDYKNVFPK